MVLDPEPKPVPDNIPIDIPSEKSKFSPRLTLPPVPVPENVPLAPPPDAAPSTAPSRPTAGSAKGPDAAKKETADAARKDSAGPAAEPASEEQRARMALEGKTSAEALPAPAKGGKFAVQAAATSSEAAAKDLSERLKKAGLPPYTERIETAEGTRYRVRIGPYATREDADRVRASLKSLGISANVVAS